MALENSVKLMWGAANSLSSVSHAGRLLKSYYLNTSRKMTRFKMLLPEENYGVAKMCPRCASQWHESEFKLRLQPQRAANTAKTRKLIQKLDASKAKRSSDKGTLTNSQRKRAKWLKKRVVSNMQIKCEFCQHKTLIPLEKPKKRIKAACTAITQAKLIQPTSGKANKPKHKDTNAGLKLGNCSSVTVEPRALAAAKPTQPQTHAQRLKDKPSMNIAKKIAVSGPPQSKCKTAKKKPQKQRGTTQTIQSKTQKQNSLLQLATLLKTQATKNANNTQQSRLDKLLM